MTKLIRITAANGTIKNVALSARVKLEPPFVGAKVEIVDAATGALVSGIKSKIVGKDLVLSFTENGKKKAVKVEDAAESAASSEQTETEAASSGGGGADVSTQLDTSPARAGNTQGADRATGLSGTTIGLGLAGLGVVGGLVATLAKSKDTLPPAAPTGLDLAAGDDSGTDNADNVTNQTSALTITGQTEANARVELFDGATSLGTTTASPTGAFSLDVTLAEGARSITAKATDAAGNIGAASSVLAITVDATPPAAPTVLDLAAVDDSGTDNADNVTNQTSALTITGQTEANARVELFDGTASIGTTTANATGAFSLDVTLAAGAHSITAKATDAAGNVGTASAALAISVDATPPAAPTVLDLVAIDDSGTDNTDNVTNQTSALTITGQTEANARVELFDGTASIGNTTANATGAFSLDVTLAAGARSITAKATDAAGNVGAASAALAISVDATAPAAPAGLDLAFDDENGADNVTYQTSALTITGQTEANARVELFDGTASIGNTTANATGAFSLDVTLAEGAHSITAKATDAAGNVSAASAALAISVEETPPPIVVDPTPPPITVDATPPAAPTGLDLAAGDDSGSDSTDNVTNQTTGLTITGTAEANALVELFNGSTSLGTTTANGSGVFTKDVALAVGARSITAKATDAAGNVSVASAALSISVISNSIAPVVELSAFASGTGNLGFVINGASAYDYSGFSVSSAGDVNGDGLDDLIVGASQSGDQDAGASYVVFGKTTGTSVNLSDIASGTGNLGFVINGASAGDRSGGSVSSAGDVNGDGLDDLIVGA
ncbi:Ig-like domain-containing protein, partial [Sphingorhabdus sp.]|uniref:Ig-like domain-containing protein n=1 Tax=Sphingorhabdus sp. TaxID=1902408 RepID=UPI002616DFFF